LPGSSSVIAATVVSDNSEVPHGAGIQHKIAPLLSGLNSRAARMTRMLLRFPYFPVSETLKSFKR
jgi:hypothetical protein